MAYTLTSTTFSSTVTSSCGLKTTISIYLKSRSFNSASNTAPTSTIHLKITTSGGHTNSLARTGGWSILGFKNGNNGVELTHANINLSLSSASATATIYEGDITYTHELASTKAYYLEITIQAIHIEISDQVDISRNYHNNWSGNTTAVIPAFYFPMCKIYYSGQWRWAVPYIYYNGWKRAIPYTYYNGNWRKGANP